MTDTLVLRRRFAARLDEAMKAKGWNQTELAKRVGLSQSSISDMLRARDPALPNGLTLWELCTALECSLDWLLLGRGTRDGRVPAAGHFFQEGGLAALLEVRLRLDEIEGKWGGESATVQAAKAHLEDERARAPRRRPARHVRDGGDRSGSH